ncbi:hypothetical protein HG263_00995 [Pseudoalteromonas sp. JBTF-M23]|uniref:Uncharacterized protein n=2 Tax=Pseudoalteromonas caenipelagi TaxID=2726988 RepID=A0A849V868_9GAMM|nr:hypothetical protein [Pseudoalteromonas caenipelagi]
MLLSVQPVIAAENYQSGKIKNITATTDGLMVMMDTRLPSNCEGTPYGWMLIEQKNTTIISVVLAAWASQAKSGTIYTSGRPDGGYCLVIQFDPAN